MAKVRVKRFTTVRAILGAATVDFEAPDPASLGGALEALIAEYGRPLREALCDPDTGDGAGIIASVADTQTTPTLRPGD